MVVFNLNSAKTINDSAKAKGLDGAVFVMKYPKSSDMSNIKSAVLGAMITSQGGVGSHAAAIAIKDKIPAIVGVDKLEYEDATGKWMFAGEVLNEGDILSLNCFPGEGFVYKGEIPFEEEQQTKTDITDGLTLPANRAYAQNLRNRGYSEFRVGLYIGVREFFDTLRPFKFFSAHGIETESWKNWARGGGIAVIWAAMALAGYYAFGISGDLFTSLAAAFAGNVLTHALYNTIVRGAQLTEEENPLKEGPIPNLNEKNLGKQNKISSLQMTKAICARRRNGFTTRARTG